jgi:hypothetical protein
MHEVGTTYTTRGGNPNPEHELQINTPQKDSTKGWDEIVDNMLP